MNDNLPPLPPCDVFGYGSRDTPDYEALGYTAEQMREYGQLCRQHALEEAAKAAYGFQHYGYDYTGNMLLSEFIRSMK